MTAGICSNMVFVTCDVTSSSSLEAPPTTLGCRASNVDRPIYVSAWARLMSALKCNPNKSGSSLIGSRRM